MDRIRIYLIFITVIIILGCVNNKKTTTTTTTITTTTSITITTTIIETTTEMPYWMRYIGNENLTPNISENLSAINTSQFNETNLSVVNKTTVIKNVRCNNGSDCGDKKVTFGCGRVYVEIGDDIYLGEIIQKYEYFPICRYPGTNRSFCEYMGPIIITEDKCYEKQMVCDEEHKRCVPPKDGNYLDFVQRRYTLRCRCGNGILENKPGCDEECEPPDSDNNEYCKQTTEGCVGHRYMTRSDDRGYCDKRCKCREDRFNTPTCMKGKCDAECDDDSDCNGGKCNLTTCLCE
ncbi:MAG: hypothetical protein DRO92_00455 [Candidatus Altiarchaeales archaeon]|nr:MAG: hypothetical protein DRO92_00455 [Candidatus Altiarchaeales archaeon]